MFQEQLLYQMIFKRKSFHLFRNIGDEKLSSNELEDITETYQQFTPLYPDIRTCIKIVPASETTCKRGQEYCILLYSEKKDNYLLNIGYLGQQLDLCLKHEGLQFERVMHVDSGQDAEKTLVAVYQLYGK